VDFGIYGVITETNTAELDGLVDAGVCGFKLFLGNTTGNLPCPSDGAVLEAFEILARRGKRISIHAENSPILFWREDRLQRSGRNTARDHLLARTDVVALEALSKSCVLAEWTGARIHIVHESTSLSLPYIEFYKSRGVDLTVETLPNYLYCSIESMEASADGYKLRMNPPIREAFHQEPLWEALRSGLIDFLSTDHAPHATHEKEGETIWDIACGFPGVESSLALMLTAVHEGRLDLNRCVQITSAAAAKAFGLYGRKGTLSPGADADLVLVDLERKEALTAERLSSRGKFSAYEGKEVTGWPIMTVRRGEVIMRDGEVQAEPGSGRMVETHMPAPAPRNLDKHLASLTT
ncbi:MAG: amidohydrolase family protein, partial [Pseudomonadota bacterium]